MGRPLRLHYDDEVSLVADDNLGSVIEPWMRHRQRFLDRVSALSDDQLVAPTRCTAWTGRDVLCHLVTVDGFFVVSLLGGKNGEPTKILPGFVPSETPEALVEPMRAASAEEIVDKFATGTNTFLETVASFDPPDWKSIAESPMGHVSARLVLAHAFWDSWLHERDILLPLGGADDVEADELFAATWYGLFFGGVQGGLLDDPAPVGPGLDTPIDVQIGFDDLDGRTIHLRVKRGVHIAAGDSPDVTVNALELSEGLTGRRPDIGSASRLPAPVLAHLQRACDIL